MIDLGIPAIVAGLFLIVAPALALCDFIENGRFADAAVSGALYLIVIATGIRDMRRAQWSGLSAAAFLLWILTTLCFALLG